MSIDQSETKNRCLGFAKPKIVFSKQISCQFKQCTPYTMIGLRSAAHLTAISSLSNQFLHKPCECILLVYRKWHQNLVFLAFCQDDSSTNQLNKHLF